MSKHLGLGCCGHPKQITEVYLWWQMGREAERRTQDLSHKSLLFPFWLVSVASIGQRYVYFCTTWLDFQGLSLPHVILLLYHCDRMMEEKVINTEMG